MNIFGIDPGSHRCGWGMIASSGSSVRPLGFGVVAAREDSLAARLLEIGDGISTLLHVHRPDVVVVEQVFHAKNSQSALKLGHARGVVLYCAQKAGMPVFEYAPAEIKRATTGKGGAPKAQVERMVRLLLGLAETIPADAADALAAAICHSASWAWQERIAAGLHGQRGESADPSAGSGLSVDPLRDASGQASTSLRVSGAGESPLLIR